MVEAIITTKAAHKGGLIVLTVQTNGGTGMMTGKGTGKTIDVPTGVKSCKLKETFIVNLDENNKIISAKCLYCLWVTWCLARP